MLIEHLAIHYLIRTYIIFTMDKGKIPFKGFLQSVRIYITLPGKSKWIHVAHYNKGFGFMITDVLTHTLT